MAVNKLRIWNEKAKEKIEHCLLSFEGFSSKWWGKLILFASLFLFIVLLHFCFCFKMDGFYTQAQGGYRNETSHVVALALGITVISLTIIFAIYLGILKLLNKRRMIGLLLIITSIVVLLLFGKYNFNNSSFKHDFAVFSNGGHWAIIYDIYQDGEIPAVDLDNQYYQIKFYHATVAYFARFMSLLIPNSDMYITIKTSTGILNLRDHQALETIRIVLAYIGILTFYLIAKIFKELDLKRNVGFIATIICFCIPIFYFVIIGGNNDLFAFFFSLLSLYLALLYRKKRSYVTIIFMAISIACGMESKLNSSIIAVPIAFMFLLEAIKVIKGKDRKENIAFWSQIVVFAVLVFPLALGGHIYNYLVYDEPFGYVLDLERNGTNYMHIDNEFYGFFYRFIAFPSPDLFYGVYNVRAYFPPGSTTSNQYVWGTVDYNVWTAFIKTSLFEEHNPFNIYGTNGFVVFLIYAAYIIFLTCSFIVFFTGIFLLGKYIRDLVMKKRKAAISFSSSVLLIILVVQAFTYAWFCYKYQVGCSMNARYALLLHFPFSVSLAYFIDSAIFFISGKVKKNDSSEKEV